MNIVVADKTILRSCCSTDNKRPHRCCHLPNSCGASRIFPIVHIGSGDASKIAPFLEKSDPPNTRFLGSTRVHTQNCSLIGSAVLAQLLVVTNRHTHTHTHTDSRTTLRLRASSATQQLVSNCWSYRQEEGGLAIAASFYSEWSEFLHGSHRCATNSRRYRKLQQTLPLLHGISVNPNTSTRRLHKKCWAVVHKFDC